ncbi:hypothetical protein DNK77_16175 [Enterobacter cloacae complex sp.]|nr:hypothetical protein DNK77_16175 [Enterobacter cloacae complex sp.]RAY68865.1 hypothetical protein DP199_17455 [Enterobacter kobei]
MVRSRAWRRHQVYRLKSKRKKYWAVTVQIPGSTVVGKTYRTPCACSCYICGNQRINHGVNMQERRAKLHFTD